MGWVNGLHSYEETKVQLGLVSNNIIVKVNYLRLNRGQWLHSYEETKVRLGPAK